MHNNGQHETRLITKETRPDLYFALLESQRAANDDESLRAFQRKWRRSHPVLASLAWIAENEWRTAAFLVGAFVVGSVIVGLLP